MPHVGISIIGTRNDVLYRHIIVPTIVTVYP